MQCSEEKRTGERYFSGREQGAAISCELPLLRRCENKWLGTTPDSIEKDSGCVIDFPISLAAALSRLGRT